MRFWFRDVLGEESLRLYVDVFLVMVLLDFFLGRILQRAFSPFATVGVLIATFASLLEFVILFSLALIFYRRGKSVLRKLTSVMIFVVAFLALAIAYVTFFSATSPPEASLLFKVASLSLFALAVFQRIRSEKLEKYARFVSYVLFSSLLVAYVFAYYYQLGASLASNYLVVTPFYGAAFLVGEYLLLFAFFFVFVYSIFVPCRNFEINPKTFSRTLLIPTLTLGPLLIITILNPRTTQYIAMLVVEILGFAFSRVEVVLFILSLWFLFAGVLLLIEKSRLSGDASLKNDALAFVLIFLGGFIFEFVYYFLIGVIGALLLTENRVS